MSDLETTARELKERTLVDRGLLKPRGQREILETITRLRARGLNAWILVLGRGEDITPWRQLWDKMGLSDSKDLLLIFNGNRWEARGWGLPPQEISAILDSCESELKVYYGRGITLALNRMGDKAVPPVTEGTPSWVLPTAGGLAVAGIAAGLTFIIRRRMQRAREIDEAFARALASAQRAHADVLLSAENLTARFPEAQELQFKAVELGQQLDAIVAEVKAHPELKGQALTIGRIVHLENELQSLMTPILQLERRVDARPGSGPALPEHHEENKTERGHYNVEKQTQS